MYKFGWERDLPDFRDKHPESPDVQRIFNRSPKLQATAKGIPATIDLKQWCSPIEDQGNLGSCTACAAAGLIEYYQKKAFNKYMNASRLFIYKTTRNLLGWTGDQGAYLRSTMKALVLFGTTSEQYWPYIENKFDDDPGAFNYTFGQNYKVNTYYRLDPAGTLKANLLASIKQKLAANLPSMFGFTVYSSFPLGNGNPLIPYPSARDSVLGGHAVVTVGYDDNKQVGSEKGALLIRNSWGTSWGEKGYAWLPYKYVTTGLAVDFWSIVQENFVDTDLFR
jgi:C1A family cysteine protease